MEKKQTAVEWLEEQYYESEGKLTRHDFEQAKQMEKEQNQLELPSDDEIGQEFKHSSENWEVRQALEIGAKWMRDKIKGGNNE